MRAFVITVALASLVIPAVMADPEPAQTPAQQVQQSMPAASAKTPAKDSALVAANADSKDSVTAK